MSKKLTGTEVWHTLLQMRLWLITLHAETLETSRIYYLCPETGILENGNSQLIASIFWQAFTSKDLQVLIQANKAPVSPDGVH